MSIPQPHNVNTDSTSNSIVQASAGIRVQAGSLNLPVSQAISINSALRHDLLIVPSSSQPTFGAFHTIDIKEKNIILNNITLQFTTSAVSGTTLVGAFVPAHYFFQRIEIVQSGNVIDTIYGNWNFLSNQLSEWNEDRSSLNIQSGRYDSLAQRTLLSSQSTTNTFYVNLKSYIDQAKMAILSQSHEIQLRVYMAPLADVFVVESGTLTACTMQSCNAICRVTRLDTASAQQRLQEMTVKPFHNVIHDLHYSPFSVGSGNTTTTIILSPFVGNVSAIYFTIRSSTVGLGAWNYLPLTSWSINDAGGANIVGGGNIPASMSANVLNRHWCKSSYNTETAFNASTSGANFYMWSHSADPISAHSQGQALSSKRYTGQESLVLNWANQTSIQYQVDVYAMVENILEMTPYSVQKRSL